MVMPAHEFELENEFEWEGEFEGEYEGELEGEFEGIFRQLWQRTADLASRIADQVPAGRTPPSNPSQEHELSPIRRVYPDALMEHLAHSAAEVESEAEAEAFIGALIPLAARLIPRVAPTIMRTAPHLIRGIAGMSRAMRRNPRTRRLVRTLPTIARRTAADIARQTARGRTVTPRAAVNSLARQTNRVLSSPQQCRGALRRSQVLDRQYHRSCAACGRRLPRRQS